MKKAKCKVVFKINKTDRSLARSNQEKKDTKHKLPISGIIKVVSLRNARDT